jgi:hypothetical protein
VRGGDRRASPRGVPAAGGLFDSVPALAGAAGDGAAGAPAPAPEALSAAEWAQWDAPVDAAAEMRALLEMWAPPADALDDLGLDLGPYMDTAALGLDLDLGVAPQSVGAF